MTYREPMDKLWAAAAQKVKEREYWLEKLSGELVKSSFPRDHMSVSPGKTTHGRVDFSCSKDLSASLIKLSTGSNVRLHIILAAGLTLLLHKYAGYDDIIVGTPILKPGVESEFVNTVLALRNPIKANMTFKELLLQVKQTVIEAGENRNYPLEVLLEQLNLPLTEENFPLFDVAILLENIQEIECLDYLNINMIFSFLRTGDEITGHVNFNSSLYDKATVKRLMDHFVNLLQAALSCPEIRISELDILSEKERQKLLFEFNDTEADYPEDKSISRLFEEQVERTPHHAAVVGPCEALRYSPARRRSPAAGFASHGGQRQTITYKQLNRDVDYLARLLIGKGITANDIAAIIVERSIEMITSLLATLKSGGAYLPIDPYYPQERVEYMLADSSASLLLTTRKLSKKAEKFRSPHVETVVIDESGIGQNVEAQRPVPAEPATYNLQLAAGSETLAYMIYTSGSTGKPKGVMIEHSSVVNLAFSQKREFNIDERDRILQFSSFCFDASVEQIFASLFSGSVLILIDKDTLLHVDKFAEFISNQAITHIHAVPSFLNNINLKYSHKVKRIISGGDICSVLLAKRLSSYCDFYNEYGPTETTVTSIEVKLNDVDESLPRLPIGKPIGNTLLYVLDKGMRLVPLGGVGELYIGGKGVARGYLNRPELTLEKFMDTKHIERSAKQGLLSTRPCTLRSAPCDYVGRSGTKLYRTGDLVRWLPGGNIDFLGRIDDQVKIRGFRIELGEIESQLLKHDGVEEAVVVVREDDDREKYLCAYIVAISSYRSLENENPMGTSPWLAGDHGPVKDTYMSPHRDTVPTGVELREYLSRTLPDYMTPLYFIYLEKIPLTPNGKVDRRNLPEPREGVSGREYAAPTDETEEKLVRIWSRVLNIESQDRLGIDDNFFELGGHSLKATTLVYQVYREFEVNIEIDEVFANPTIRGLAQRIRGMSRQEYFAITPTERKEYYELSYAQRRLWVLCQFEEDSTAYNMPSALTISGRFDPVAFKQAVQTLVERHESLRTIFILVDGAPRQRVIPGRDFKYHLEEVDLQGMDEAAKDKEARKLFVEVANRAFNLEIGPLFRFRLVRLQGKRYLLFFNIHHIVNDGWSQDNINNEILHLYNAHILDKEKQLPPIQLQYKDYTLWHNEVIKAGSFSKSRQYWLEKFNDKPNGIELPLDHSRQPIQTFNGGRVSFSLDAGKTEQLHKISLQEDVTLFMSLLALVDIFLYKYTGQDDIILGAPIANRKRPEFYPLVGFLVNTLVYRNRLSPAQTFRQLLSAVKEETLACYEYQDYPFDLLIEELGLDRDLSQSPLFNVMLAHNNADIEEIDLVMEGVTISEYVYSEDFNMSKFDLIFFMDERRDEVFIRIEYNSDLFERSSIERMADNFLTLVDDVIENNHLPLSGLSYIDDAEYERVIREFNDNDYPFPSLTLQQLFENRVEQNPEKIAVVGTGPDVQGHPTVPSPDDLPDVTYRDLNRRVNQLAHYLREEYKIKPNDVIGISMDRSIEMIIVLLGIIKSGAGYLALDPTYPQERVLHVLSDSKANLLIIDKMRPELFADYRGEILDITCRWQDIYGKSPHNPPPVNQPSDILYVNYTSGSTGTPNGAMLSHDCLTNLIQWQNETTTIDCGRRVLQFTSVNFCVSFQEIMGTLTSGGELHLIGDVERQDINYLLDFLSEHQIEILFLPFSYLNFLFNESGRWNRSFKHNLKHIITAGEQLKITTGLKRFLDLNPALQLHNHYGSTEMHVVTSYTLDSSTAGRTPIPPAGKPINNVDIFILDEYLNPLPMGVWGEIFVKGSSEILGYINNERLTEQKLIAHPQFSADGIRLYRSGDIGRWLEDGNIELRGRKDFQVKIRGFRIEPGEIESKILAIRNVRECVVVVKEDGSGQKYLVAYVVLENIDVSEIKKILVSSLPQYMLPQFVVLEKLPLMHNGKVDREKLPEPGFDTAEDYTAPRDRMEMILAEIWSEILMLEKDRIGIDTNFFESGGHSLKATLMVSHIQKKLGRRVPLIEIFKRPTIRELAGYIRGRHYQEYAALEPARKKENYRLSSAQKRLFILQQMEKDNIGYNMPIVVLLEGILDKERFAGTFRKLIARHESLRTSFHMVDEEAVQKVHDPRVIQFEIEYYSAERGAQSAEQKELNTGREEARCAPCAVRHASTIEDFIRPFDLSQAPLLRVGLIPTPAYNRPQSRSQQGIVGGIAGDKHILMVDMHHIVSDGTSLGIFTREFMALYAGEELPPLSIHYKDFAEWQNSEKQSESLVKQENYWRGQFAGEIPVLDLPTDFARPAIQSFAGRTLTFEIGPEETAALNKMALDQGATLFMVLLAAYSILLAKLSGQEDLVVGTPTAGRRHADLQGIIGMFINTLSIRNYPTGRKTFRAFLQEIKTGTLEAFENQEYQFEDLVETVEVERDISRNPLFDMMFALQNMDITEVEIPGLKLSPYEYENRTAKFDMMLLAYELEEHLLCNLEYCTSLFKKETVEKFISYFRRIISSVIEDFDKKIMEIEILSLEEREQILLDFNDTAVDYPQNKTIHNLFSEQAGRTADNTAVVGRRYDARSMVHLTYRELDREVDTLARILIEKGVETEDIVGMIVERSVEMIVGVLGILRAGGAYLPIEPDCPQDRKGYILRDSGAKVLLTSRGVFKEGRKSGRAEARKNTIYEVETIFLDYFWIESPYSSDTSDQESRGESMYSPYLSDQEPWGESMYSPVSRDIEEVETFRSLEKDTPGRVFKEPATCNLQPVTISSNLCYVIYTSGSTGKPKGVMVEHRSVVNVLYVLFGLYPLSKRDTYLFKTSYVFDVSVTELFGWFLEGGRLAILERGDEKDPMKILEAIEKDKVTHINFVPSMFKAFMDVLNRENMCRLSGLKYLFLAGEALLPELVKKFRSLKTGVVLENLYGPTEASVYASKYSLRDWQDSDVVPIGKPLGNVNLYVLNQYDRLQAVGIPGELIIAGAGLARGYLNRPGLTAEKFVNYKLQITNDKQITNNKLQITNKHEKAVPHHSSFITHHSALLYKTGDLARWQPDGNIDFLGRKDHQVKIRGFRIELGEIENQLVQHEAVDGAVVIDKAYQDGDKYLCAYIVERSMEIPAGQPLGGTGGREIKYRGEILSSSELREYLSRTLPDYMIPSRFVFLETIPLTTSGKVNRKMLPEPGIEAGKENIAPRDSVEKRLAEIWSEVLFGDTFHTSSLGIDNNFFELGGHSIKATLLINRIHRIFNIDLPLTEVFKHPTIRGMAPIIHEVEKSLYTSITPIEEKDYYPVSSAQKRMFILNKLKGNDTSDNTPYFFMIEGKLEKIRFEEVIKQLINRHETLRTSFELIDEVVVQRVYRQVDFEIDYMESFTGKGQDEKIERAIKDFIRPFDLGKAPLLRVSLLKLSPEKYLLMYDIHHIVKDGTSSLVFMREFVSFYNGDALPKLRIQYKDFSIWQNRLLHSEIIKKQEEYWLEVFSGEIPVLSMPGDFPRPVVQSFEGDCIRFELDQELSQGVLHLALEHDATLYMVLLSVYTILLSKYSGQEDIVVGTPIAGRPHLDLENLIGMFVNTLAMRNFPKGELTFARFLEEVKHNALKAYENQDYQFEELVNALGIQPDPARQSLFDTMFAVQNVEVPHFRTVSRGVGGLNFRPYPFEDKVTQFDIMFHAFENEQAVSFKLLYCTRLFTKDTILMLIQNFKEIISIIVENRDIKLKDIIITHELFDKKIEMPQTGFSF